MSADETAALGGMLLVMAIVVMGAFGGFGMLLTAGRTKEGGGMTGLKRLGVIALFLLFIAIFLSQPGVGQAFHDIFMGAWQNFLEGFVRPAVTILTQVLVVAALGVGAVFLVRYIVKRRA